MRKKGTIGRFINHSCEPNCTIEIWNVRGKLKPGIFTLKDISKGEELSFDYKWKPSNNRPLSKCYCGTKSCRGYLEVVTEQDIENNELLLRVTEGTNYVYDAVRSLDLLQEDAKICITIYVVSDTELLLIIIVAIDSICNIL